MAVDNAIVAQTAAKVAAEMVASLEPRTVEDAKAAFDSLFNHVLANIHFATGAKKDDRKTTKGGRQVPILSQEEIQMKLNQKLQAGSSVSSTLLQL